MGDLEAVLEADPTEVNLFANGVFLGEVGCIHLQRHLKLFPNIQLLELKGSCIGRAGAEYLSVGLRNSQIRHLGVGRNGIDHIGSSMLLKALQSTPIETLDLEWNSLQDGVAPALASLLEVTTTLMSLSLERNDLRTEGVSILAQALCVNRSLRNLNLAWNRTGSVAAIKLGEMLQKNSTLLTLNLSQNGIPAEGAKALAIGLSKNHALRSLNLQNNQAADAFANFTSSASDSQLFSPSLRELNLGGNRLQVAWAGSFAANLATATHLVGLSLSKCNIGEAPMKPILSAVSSMTYLSTLDISGCLLSSKNGVDVAVVLTRCANLGNLVLDDNRLEDMGVEQLSNALASCNTLTSLSLRNCEIDLDGTIALSTAIKARRGLPLCELNLGTNRMGDEGCLVLCNALTSEAETSLVMLDITSNAIGSRSCVYLASVLKHHPDMPSILIRGNPLGDDMRSSYLTLEAALGYTGGIACEAVVATGKGTTSVQNSVKVVRNNDDHASTLALRKNNFNGSTDITAATTLPFASSSSPVGAAMRDDVQVESAASSSSLDTPHCLSTSSRAHVTTSVQTQVSTNHDVFVPGMTPSAPPIKRSHELHRVEDNISGFPITDTQLRQKFVELDMACSGFVDADTFLAAYQKLDPVSAELSDTRVRRAIKKMCPDGLIGYQQFCVLMLKLANL